jgi:hypothetical protein
VDRSYILTLGISAAMWIMTFFFVLFGIPGLTTGALIGSMYVITSIMLYRECRCEKDRPH